MNHRVLILGIDGYIGWALTHHLLDLNYEVCGLDNGSRRQRVWEVGSDSLTPIPPFSTRERIIKQYKNFIDSIACVNLHDAYLAGRVLREYKPNTVIHLAEQPSAPWSMRDERSSILTQTENIAGTLALLWGMKKWCPDAHLIKLGTMGEYGTPNCDIPEGEIPDGCLHPDDLRIPCPMAGLPFPRSPWSFYHLSKVHDTHNIIFACKNWGLTSTDIMQGVVFGVTDNESEERMTRFDYDQYFGTVINRFCVQSLLDIPLTIYGKGNQTRGYLPLKDSLQCLTIALRNPPPKGTYLTLNQFENIYSINQLAYEVSVANHRLFGKEIKVDHLPNPRKEIDQHYYSPGHQRLFDLGYEPTTDIRGEIIKLINYLKPFKDRAKENVINPTTQWR